MADSLDTRKLKELRILREALIKARERGGESRRLVDKISGSIETSERPDFLVRTQGKGKRPPALIGVEHFRVDHFSALQKGRKNKEGNQGSLVVPIQREVDKMVRRLDLANDLTHLPKQMLNDMSAIYAHGIAAHMRAGYRSYVDSMAEGLSKHTSKAAAYRSNVRAAAREGEGAELAFLVEVRSDFSDTFVNDTARSRRLTCGMPVFFEEMKASVEAAAREADYLIFAFYPAFTDDIADAMVVNCRSMRKSLERNKVQFLQYFGADQREPVYGKGKVIPLITNVEEDGETEIEFRTSFETMGKEAELSSCLSLMPEAVRMKAEGIPFAASTTMQFLLDVFGDAVVKEEELTLARFAAIRDAMGSSIVKERAKKWIDRWFPDTAAD